ncbi:MAG: methyltransferase domain-containing protein [Halobacteriota archaeon]
MIERDEPEETPRPRDAVEYGETLELYLKQVGEIFNISDIIEEPQEKPQIINYFLSNRLLYRLGHNWGGFYHSGISYDGAYKKDDLKEPARIVERYIHEMDAKSVLEPGSGLGSNSAFLARRNPSVGFEAIDLSNKPLRSFSRIPNLSFHCGDYHDLSRFEDASFDLAFMVETLCHSKNKPRVLREVKKKLKTNGLLITFDAYYTNDTGPLTQPEDIMCQLVTKSLAVDRFERLDDVEGYMRQEYSIEVSKDISAYVIPFYVYFENRRDLRFYFNHTFFAKTVNRILPLVVVKNFIAVLLVATTLQGQLSCYYQHVLRKDH